MDPNDSIPYEVRIKNYIYQLQQQPHKPPTEEELDELEEITSTEYAVNRMYGETVRPVLELIQMGRIEEAKRKYESISDATESEPIKTLVKIK